MANNVTGGGDPSKINFNQPKTSQTSKKEEPQNITSGEVSMPFSKHADVGASTTFSHSGDTSTFPKSDLERMEQEAKKEIKTRQRSDGVAQMKLGDFKGLKEKAFCRYQAW